jgi:hypothetical protein
MEEDNYREQQGRGNMSTSNIEILDHFQSETLRMMWMLLGTCRIRLTEEISRYQQLKKKSSTTAPNTVIAPAHTQMTEQ